MYTLLALLYSEKLKTVELVDKVGWNVRIILRVGLGRNREFIKGRVY